MPQLLCGWQHARAVRPARLRLRENESRGRRKNRLDDARIHPRPRQSCRHRDSHRLPPRSTARRTRSGGDGRGAWYRSDSGRDQVRQVAPLPARRRAQTLRLDARTPDFLLGDFRRGYRRLAPSNPCRRSLRLRQARRFLMAPEVSVIIPAYNRCAMLLEAIDSVLAQSIPAFELIVIDDGSTDGTNETEQVERLTETIRIERIEHSGPAAARNRGVAIARAPLVAF